MKPAILFPGQGAQKVGMGKDVCEASPAAAAVFEQAEQAVEMPLRKLCFEGPEETLARTDVCQPAIFTVSAAMLAAMAERLGDDAPQPALTAGLSLGEYTALYAAGGVDLATGVRLVARRGAEMQRAAEQSDSGMVSVLGIDEDAAWKLAEAAAEAEVLVCANFNCPGQVVLSGQKGACKRAADLAEQFGASGAVELKVAGAFHSELIRPAADALAETLAEADIRKPRVPVVSNVDARPHEDPDDIRRCLLEQLTSPVRWQQCMEYMLANGVEKFYEVGPGRVLAGLMKRIKRRADFTSINSNDTIEKLARTG
ncbi:MAG: ACP S-malonyltransferase [Phycisphaerae bacterium]